LYALVHVADPFAVLCALFANLRAFATGVLVMRRTEQHEMRGRSANFRAGHHQAKVCWLEMFTAHFEAVRHRGA
jgi:hypothetical protein